jgi:phenylalanyl-tRNA synthetase beta chain
VKPFQYVPVSEFPVVERDLALIADEALECAAIEKEIKKACKNVEKAELFDVYRSAAIGLGKKSMAFKISFAPEDKALTPDDINRFVKKILGNLKFRLGIEMR